MNKLVQKKDGDITFYYDNGQKKKEGNLKDDVLNGKVTTYNIDGSIKKIKEY